MPPTTEVAPSSPTDTSNRAIFALACPAKHHTTACKIFGTECAANVKILPTFHLAVGEVDAMVKAICVASRPRMLLDDTAGVGIQSIYAEWHISVEHRELFYTGSELFLRVRGLALQLPFMRTSESMGNHDSEIVDAGSVD